MQHSSSLRQGRRLSFLAGTGAFLFFCTTMSRGLHPGESARQVAMALRLEPDVVPLEFVAAPAAPNPFAPLPPAGAGKAGVPPDAPRPPVLHTKQALWRLCGSAAPFLPPGKGTAPFRLDLLSALLGSLCVAYAFALGRGLTLLNSRGNKHFSRRTRRKASLATGAAAAVILSLSAPFWTAATRCSPEPLAILLVLGMSYALFRAIVSHDKGHLLLFGVLLGLDALEWQVGLFLVPLFLFFAARAMKTGAIDRIDGASSILLGTVLGVAGYLYLCTLASPGGSHPPSLAFRELSASIRYGTGLLLGGLFESNALLTSFCLSALPFLAMVAMAIWRGEGAIAGSFALVGLFSICALDLPVSPWGIARSQGDGSLPMASCLFNAAIGTYLFGQGALLTHNRLRRPSYMREREEEDFDEELFAERRKFSQGRSILLYLLVFVPVAAVLAFPTVRGGDGLLLDRVAALTAEEMGDRDRVLMGDGELATLLRIHSNLLGKEVLVLDPFGAEGRPGQVREWLAGPAETGSRLLLMDPGSITDAGREAVPALLGFRAVARGASIDWDRLADRHLAFWRELTVLPPPGREAPGRLRAEHAALLDHLVAVGDHLAEGLRTNGRERKAQNVRETLGRLAGGH